MWNKIKEAIDNDKSLAVPIMYFLSNSINEATNPHRMGASIVGFDPNAKKLYYEHAMQSTNAYRALMESILSKSNFNTDLQNVKNNYKIIAIDAADNAKLDKAGLKNSMPPTWKVENGKWWQRYFNNAVAKVGGINPNNLIFWESNQTFAEQLNINEEGKSRKEDLYKIF